MTDILHGALGAVALLAFAWAIGEERRAGAWRIAAAGLAIQIVLAALLLVAPFSKAFFAALNEAVLVLQEATRAGTAFVFGYLGGGPLPFEETQPGASFVLAFRALPLILVVSALAALLTYWRILPLLIRGLSMLLERSLGVGGAVGLGAAANIFVGMVEAPLLIGPYLARLSRSELFAVMCTGMATIAGTVLVLYATIIGNAVPDAAGHLLVASVISAPAAITVSLLMVPPDATRTGAVLDTGDEASGAMDAITRGAQRGVNLLINVVAMLVVLVALVHLVNAGLALAPEIAGRPISLQRVLGVVMSPVVWLIGIPWSEARIAGELMGTKIVLNEFIAYIELAGLHETALGERSRLIMTYALCGFANFGSLGIMIGGLTTIVPERRREIVGLGMKSIVGGTLATCLTGAVVGMVS